MLLRKRLRSWKIKKTINQIMKKLITLLCLIASMQSVFAQTDSIDVKLQKIVEEKNEEAKWKLVFGLSNAIEGTPNVMITKGLKLLQQSKEKSNEIDELVAYYILNYSYRLVGNRVQALDYNFKGLTLAEKMENQPLIVFLYNEQANIYKNAGENERAIAAYFKGIELKTNPKYDYLKIMPICNLGAINLETNKLDSALIFTQKAYELSLKTESKFFENSILRNLGSIHSKMGNELLAKSYFAMAINGFLNKVGGRSLSTTYFAFAEYFNRFNQKDSCIYYSKKAIEVVQDKATFYLGMQPAKLLAEIYETTNSDSALKYTKLYHVANDSINSNKANQQLQQLAFAEDLRKQETEDQRKQNIQYALIAIGIIVLLSLYLLLSRSFITNTKMIEFFGVVALLIVFEFLNLLLHPFLERITHHNPVLMLLSLVCIAALLVPLHHKVEHWATAKLVEKNKQLRLKAAKKTIEQLEKEN
jgi:tetratricopeptide (TPR) repeat protein